MSTQKLTGKVGSWWHVTNVNDQDIAELQTTFKFHALDYEDVREGVDLPKIDTYKYYTFCVFTIPVYSAETKRLSQINLDVFLSKDGIVTLTKEPVPAVEELFTKAGKHSGWQRDLANKSPAEILHSVLDAGFKACQLVVRQLVKEANRLEQTLANNNFRQVTIDLARLRRNALFLISTLKPQSKLLGTLVTLNRHVIPEELNVYFEDVQDSLDGMLIVCDNLRNLSDTLFEMNETFLAHRTNDTIRTLTIISVSLMPPTLLASAYGMNVEGLPLADDPTAVLALLTGVLFLGLTIMSVIDRRRFKD